jgi:hypothetical protein
MFLVYIQQGRNSTAIYISEAPVRISHPGPGREMYTLEQGPGAPGVPSHTLEPGVQITPWSRRHTLDQGVVVKKNLFSQ